jgi:DinB family protein
MHPRLTELRDFVDAQRSALLSAASAVPPDRWTERPVPGRWSVTELFEHLYKVEHSCARAIAKGIADARVAGPPLEDKTSSVLGGLDGRDLMNRSKPLQAPDRVVPQGSWTREQALEALASSRAELHAAMEAGDGLALGSVHLTHARLGVLDLYQWILFIGQHEMRHVAQAREISEQLVTAAR